MAADKMTWEELKNSGSDHYRLGEVQPFDLYKSMDTVAFRHWVTLEAVQHLLRNLTSPRLEYIQDLDKAEHYIKTLKVLLMEKDEKASKDPLLDHYPAREDQS